MTREGQAPVALVTGTSRGLGKAVARRMIDEGYQVVGVSRTPSDITGAFTEILADISVPDIAEAALQQCWDTWGRLDVLVNNAAGITYRSCWEYTAADLDQLLALNVTAPFVLATAAVRRWLDAGDPGSIVNICSIESEVAWPDPPQAAYAMTKGGLAGLTRAMAYELADRGVRVIGVAPGVIDTDMTPTPGSVTLPEIPLGRLARADEIAAVVAFVASPAASYVTGEIVYADGGFRLP